MNIDERKKDMGETRKTLAKEFNDCRPILSVLGDTTRQSFMFIGKYENRWYESW